MKKIFIILSLSLAWNVQAEGLHLDFGLAYHDPKTDSFRQKDNTNISNLIGEVELKYEWENGTSVFIRHNSSVQQNDTGLNMIGIKARLF